MQLETFCELGIFLLISYCAWRAHQKHESGLFLFLIFDAWLFEWVIISLLRDVKYSEIFHLSLLGIPLVVVFGWVILLYSFHSIFKKLDNIFLKALIVAVVVVTLDMIMDTVAVHYGLWQWKSPNGYFGIPYNNFFGWFSYSFLISLAISLFYKHSVWLEYCKILAFVTCIGLIAGGIWYIAPLAWLWWVLYGFSLLYVLKNLNIIKNIDLDFSFIILPVSFLLFSIWGMVFSLESFSNFFVVFSGLWVLLLVYFFIRLYKSGKRGSRLI